MNTAENQVSLYDLIKRCVHDLDYRKLSQNNRRYCTLHLVNDKERVFTCPYLGDNNVIIIEASEQGARLASYYQCCNGRVSREERG